MSYNFTFLTLKRKSENNVTMTTPDNRCQKSFPLTTSLHMLLKRKKRLVMNVDQPNLVTSEMQSDLVMNEIHPDIVTNEFHPDIVANEIHPDIVTNEIHPDIITNEIHPDIVTNEIHPDIVMNEIHPDIVTNEIHPDIVTNEIHPDIVTNKIYPDIIRREIQSNLVTSEIQSDSLHAGYSPFENQSHDCHISVLSSSAVPETLNLKYASLPPSSLANQIEVPTTSQFVYKKHSSTESVTVKPISDQLRFVNN